MRTRRLIVVVVAVLSMAALSGCGFVADGPFGWVYTDTTTSTTIGTAETGEKTGSACITSYLGAVSIGDASIEAAMEAGGIKEVRTVNKENFSVFGTYTKQCTIVSGA